ncbi:hypothetical protein I7I50_00006 [Histoplasma capsulatum G186AR]|uniref:Uncharacterized protein n=1 Tax=Ajellomyces capsulatus TaxID=5037 RepID=A0A8H8CTQ2_AJECA|nr:hypothetical protein I7I52_07275 [Histoplasma capsulatum]QSS72223.1 hypothetical protein I7I50_00006 [Histoplasma capsulatum G186AR]
MGANPSHIVNKALQDLAAELLTVVDNKVKGVVLRRCTALHVKRFITESKPRVTSTEARSDREPIGLTSGTNA